MNVANSGESSSCAVKSKYFTGNLAMDESLTSFQEKKNNCVGPKITDKKNRKPRKAPKRPRGQKDIRTTLWSVKNELKSYSKDFDKVCKKAGIDVDSEQLQIAIALSKSLQETASTSIQATKTQTINTQDRIGKIRTTLQEYGFKVPEVKIACNTRKVWKHRKNYKLMQTSESEKKEIIANRYSHILFQDITHCSLYCSDVDANSKPLYYLASNVSYETLKTDIFHVYNLIEKSESTGILLRDWSEIPGRPYSPKLYEPMNMNISEIECSQEELDIILSGSLKSCKDVLKKIKDQHNSNYHKNIVKHDLHLQNINKEEINTNQDCTLVVDIGDTEPLNSVLALNKHRSSSPDMFDDDESEILINDSKHSSTEKETKYSKLKMTKPNTAIIIIDPTECDSVTSQFKLNLTATNEKSNDMELTECIQMKNNITIDKWSQLSQKTNITKRRTNDFMELTECVATLSQPFLNKYDLTQSPDNTEENTLQHNTANKEKISLKSSEIINNIDLTKSPENNNRDIDYIKTPLGENTEKDIQKMDFTQSSNTSDELPFISFPVTYNESLNDSDYSDKTVILDRNDYVHIGNKSSRNIDKQIDLAQTFLKDNITQSQSFFSEYIHEHSESQEKLKDKSSDKISNACEENYDSIDLTQTIERQSSYDSSQDSKDNFNDSYTKSHLHQNYSQIIIESIPVEDHPSNYSIKNVSREATINLNNQYVNNSLDEIDLTQNSNTSEEFSQILDKGDENNIDATYEDLANGNDLPFLTNLQIYSNFGKKDNISVDYDEIIDNIDTEMVISKMSNTEPVIHKNVKHFSRTNSILSSNCSQNSEVFEISDPELDYSIHKSKLEIQRGNFAFGGISIMDELSNFGASKQSTDIDTNSTTTNDEIENFLSLNEEKNSNEISPIKHRRITEIATPQKACSSNMIMTPKNSEMIIKINDVTPMVDYESMSTPDIHKELDKYGIKPFKRKRAIQLLTHIYNQTHPIIETFDDLASPPKRRKLNDSPSPTKLIQRQILKDTDISKITYTDNEKENNVKQNNKGKGKGKGSLRNAKKHYPEKLNDDVETQNEKRTEKELPKLKEIECSSEDWVFQKREKAKVHSCRVPLHIAFYNYVSSRRDLREAILCYEPVEIDLIHKDLVEYGHRYDPKDLLKFLDKRCITVKTTDNDGRNQKR